jgi:hypothetical protein
VPGFRRVGELALAIAGLVFVVSVAGFSSSRQSGPFITPFDQYGRINWEAEEARLDNFAIQLLNDPDSVGYIFIYDGNDLCDGEAQARAIRAKTYLVERRGIPWNRVIWRHDGYREQFMVALQPVSRSLAIPYPFLPSPEGLVRRHVKKLCPARIAEIRKPNT